MESVAIRNQALSVEDIIKMYPNQWVLLGNPILRNPQSNGSILNRLITGIVLLAGKDKRELAYKAKDFVDDYEETACIYTGEIAKNRIYLL
ncbi:MAG: hypothetical protein U5L45_26905 [Saprospiraceae bacterium]|nr:hypothetical protein [Saprospiraceae bacterium]